MHYAMLRISKGKCHQVYNTAWSSQGHVLCSEQKKKKEKNSMCVDAHAFYFHLIFSHSVKFNMKHFKASHFHPVLLTTTFTALQKRLSKERLNDSNKRQHIKHAAVASALLAPRFWTNRALPLQRGWSHSTQFSPVTAWRGEKSVEVSSTVPKSSLSSAWQRYQPILILLFHLLAT